MLEPGGRFLITPISGFLASATASGDRSLQPVIDEGLDRVIKAFDEKEGKDHFILSIDSIIFDDGTLIGPDTVKRGDHVNEQIRAEKEVLDSVYGLQGDALEKQLALLTSLRGMSSYSQFRFSRADYLKAVKDHDGEAAAIASIDKLRARHYFVGSESIKKATEDINQ